MFCSVSHDTKDTITPGKLIGALRCSSAFFNFFCCSVPHDDHRSMREKGLECNGRAAAMVLTALSRSKDWGGAAKFADALGDCGVLHTDYR